MTSVEWRGGFTQRTLTFIRIDSYLDFVSEALFKNASGKFIKISDWNNFGKSLLIQYVWHAFCVDDNEVLINKKAAKTFEYSN